MQVLMINGSPHKHGCTFTALSEVAGELEKQGIKSVFRHVGAKDIRGCIACMKCAQTGVCIFNDDPVNECVELLKESDAMVVGSPTYYAGPSATVCALLERMFFMKSAPYALKPGAVVVSCRRGGATANYDRLYKFFSIASMPLVTSHYWNMVHGNTPEEVKQDLEGMQTMRVLGRNMAWLLKCIENSKGAVPLPEQEERAMTNFIR